MSCGRRSSWQFLNNFLRISYPQISVVHVDPIMTPHEVHSNLVPLLPHVTCGGGYVIIKNLILPVFNNFLAYSPQLLYLYVFFNHYHRRSVVLSYSARWPYKGSQIQPNCRISWYAFLIKDMCRDVQTGCVQKLFLLGYVQKQSILG